MTSGIWRGLMTHLYRLLLVVKSLVMLTWRSLEPFLFMHDISDGALVCHDDVHTING